MSGVQPHFSTKSHIIVKSMLLPSGQARIILGFHQTEARSCSLFLYLLSMRSLRSEMQMSVAEQQFVNTSQRVRKECEARLEEVRRAGEEDVHLKMDAAAKRIMQQNRSLQEELRIHIEVLCTLLGPVCCLCKLHYKVKAMSTRINDCRHSKTCTACVL